MIDLSSPNQPRSPFRLYPLMTIETLDEVRLVASVIKDLPGHWRCLIGVHVGDLVHKHANDLDTIHNEIVVKIAHHRTTQRRERFQPTSYAQVIDDLSNGGGGE